MRRPTTTAVFSLSLAALTLWFAVPRAVVGVIMFESRDTMQILRAGRKTSPTDTDRLLSNLLRSLSWSETGSMWVDYGFVQLAANARKKNPKLTGRKSVGLSAAYALRKGLSLAPVNGQGWYLLALVHHATSGPSERSVAALSMSLFTGPHIPVLAVVRLRLLLRHWQKLDPDGRNAVYGQIRYAWSISPDGLIDIALNARNIWPIRIALARQPKDLQRFEKMLKARRSKSN